MSRRLTAVSRANCSTSNTADKLLDITSNADGVSFRYHD